MPSPNAVENFLLALERRLEAFIGRRMFLAGGLITLACLLVAARLPNMSMQLGYRDVNLQLLDNGLPLSVVLLPAALLVNLIFVPSRHQFFWAVAFSLLAATVRQQEAGCGIIRSNSFTIVMFACLGFCKLYLAGWLSRLQTLALCLSVAGTAGVMVSRWVSPPGCASLFWDNSAQFYAAFLIGFLAQPKEEMNLGLVANPTHLVFARVFYFPFGDLGPAHPFAAGLVKCVKSFLFLFLLSLLLELPTEKSSLAHAFFRYVATMVGMMSLANFCVGITEICGIRCPPATYFLPLARSPRDYLRRESIYGYMFCFQFVFLPLVRWLKRPKVAAFVFFLSFPLFREGFQLLFREPDAEFDSWRSAGFVLWAWGIWMLGFFAADTERLKPLFNRDRWSSVAYTHGIMFGPFFLRWAITKMHGPF